MLDLKFYKKELNREGLKYFLSARAQKISDKFDFNISKKLRSDSTFLFQNKKYHYLIEKYNYAWKNERSVEIPISWEMVKRYKGKKILEIGNVLSHYYKTDHTIVDKYEKEKGVINEDVVSFKSNKKYDLILAISTLEHVGWEEKSKEPLKILKAVKNMKKLAGKDGEILITLPINYSNPKLNELINKNKLGFSSTSYLKRVSKHKWIESDLEGVKNVKYNSPFPNSNAILVGIIKNT